jgi:hypothetical protein
MKIELENSRGPTVSRYDSIISYLGEEKKVHSRNDSFLTELAIVLAWKAANCF